MAAAYQARTGSDPLDHVLEALDGSVPALEADTHAGRTPADWAYARRPAHAPAGTPLAVAENGPGDAVAWINPTGRDAHRAAVHAELDALDSDEDHTDWLRHLTDLDTHTHHTDWHGAGRACASRDEEGRQP